MAEIIDIQQAREELAHRRNHGLDVTLFWSKADDEVTVEVVDERMGEVFEIRARRECALDAFHHPYAYAAAQGVEYLDAA